jgi:hypothetical protein
MTERWRPVPGFGTRYEVSDQGRVRSRAKSAEERMRSLSANSQGYHTVDLWNGDGTSATKRVHRLVLEAFVGPAPAGHEACHGNGDRTDNRLENLRWDVRTENMRDVVRHGHNVNSQKQACPQGHPYDTENTYARGSGRGCKECRRDATRRWRQNARSTAA